MAKFIFIPVLKLLSKSNHCFTASNLKVKWQTIIVKKSGK